MTAGTGAAPGGPAAPRARGRLRFALASSVVDQGLASGISFVLTIVVGRRLGASGLGSVAFALALYLVLAGFHRGLVLEPLAVQRGAGGGPAALFGSLVLGVCGSALLFGVASVAGGATGAATAALAPWVTFGLVVETVRVAGHRQGKPTAGLTSHALWAVVMAAWLLASRDGFGVADAATSWGAGAAAAAALGCLRLRSLPSSPGAARAWWRTAWPLGRWLALQTAVYTAGINGAQFGVAVVAGPAALGTLRGVQTLFAPLTLLLPALNVPALPVVARTLRASRTAARSLALRLTVFLCGACGVYLVVALVARRQLTTLAFGSALELPAAVMWPIAVGQLLVAASLGSFLLLKAAEDGRGVFWATAAGAGVTFATVLPLAHFHGAAGAGWGIALGGLAATAVALMRAPAVVKDGPRPRVRVRMAPTR